MSSSSSVVDKKMLVLKSSDGQTFEVEERVAFLSQTIKNMVKNCEDDNLFPFPNVTGPILAKVIEYCKYHVEARDKSQADNKAKEDLKKFDEEFIKVEPDTLLYLIMAAEYLNIKGLVNLTYETLFDMLMKDPRVRRRKKSERLSAALDLISPRRKKKKKTKKKRSAGRMNELLSSFSFLNIQS